MWGFESLRPHHLRQQFGRHGPAQRHAFATATSLANLVPTSCLSKGDIISATIGRLSEISATIAASVEQQRGATQEISRNVQQAASGTTQVSSSIGEVERGASETGSASSQVVALTRESHRLKSEMARFLGSIRAA